MTRVIDDLVQRVGDVFRGEFERAGYSSKVAPIYANALVGMVTLQGTPGRTSPVGFMQRVGAP